MKWLGALLLVMAILQVWLIGGGGVDSRRIADASTSGAFGNAGFIVQNEDQHRAGGRNDVSMKGQSGINDSAKLDNAYAAIREQGDFRPLRELLAGMSPNERFSIMYAEFPGLRSRLGSGNDFRAKLAIINEFGGNRAEDFKNKVLKSTGVNLDPIGDKDFIMSLDDESWKAMVSGAAQQNSSKAFELALGDIGVPHSRMACSEVVKVWLGLDPMAASKRISEMPRSPLKDVAICELVDWVIKKDGPESATAWIAEISDKTIRDNLVIESKKYR